MQQERHGTAAAAAEAAQVELPARVAAHPFFQSFVAFCSVHVDRTSLHGLGICGAVDDPFRTCPVCAQLPPGAGLIYHKSITHLWERRGTGGVWVGHLCFIMQLTLHNLPSVFTFQVYRSL